LHEALTTDPTILPRHAWQPFTPRGVAAFAGAPLARLWLVQTVMAVCSAAMALWFASANWVPVAREAARCLPHGAAIRDGLLHWTTNTPVRLAENRFLALVVDAPDTGALGRASDAEVALHDTHFTVASLLGYIEFGYPRAGWSLSLDSNEAIPWWGAWEGPLLMMVGALVVVGLLASWFVLTLLYTPGVWFFGFFANRRLGWTASWKLAGAALMPGALILNLGVIAYGALGLDLFRLALVFVLHLLAGWIYLAVSPYFMPKVPETEAAAANPFATDDDTAAVPKRKSHNPFAPPD